MNYPLDIEIRFLERHYRNSPYFECCVEVTTEGDPVCQVVYSLGATWEEALVNYPTIDDLKNQINRLPEFQGWVFGVVDIQDADGLY